MKIENIYLVLNKINYNLFSPIALILLFSNETIESVILIILSIIIHEMGHLVAIDLLYVQIEKIHIEPFGCSISINKYTSYKKEIIIALSGPLLGLFVAFLCCFLHNTFPSIYLFYFMVLNLSYALINLFPCDGLDGGLVIRSIIYLLFDSNKAYKITELIYKTSSVIVVLLMIFTCLHFKFNMSLTSLCIFILIIFPHKRRNGYI